jgi:hypothetical protein
MQLVECHTLDLSRCKIITNEFITYLENLKTLNVIVPTPPLKDFYTYTDKGIIFIKGAINLGERGEVTKEGYKYLSDLNVDVSI